MNWLSFTYGWFLLGGLSALIPLYLHLRYRRQAPRVDFPTVRFLLLSVRKTAHRRRIYELLLLILRMAALLLLAAGLAGPIVRAGGLLGRGDTTLALVLDNSLSMAAESKGRPRYSQAKELAQDAARRLSPSSRVALLFTNRLPSSPEGSVEGLPTANKEQVVAEIERSEVSAAEGSVGQALARAVEILSDAPTPNREIWIISDLQEASWRGVKPEDVKVPVVVADCSTTGHRNVAVVEAAVRSKGLAVGIPVSIQAKILNAAERDEPNVGVSLYLENERRAHRTVGLGVRTSAVVSFQEVFAAPGVYSGWVQVDLDDDLEHDNRRYFAVHVPERIDVLLVRDEEGPVPVLDDLFYLVPALDPAEAGVSGARSVVRPSRLLRRDLPGASLDRYAAVMLANCAELLPDEEAALKEYALRGGSVVVFPGERFRPEAWRPLHEGAAPGEPALLPALPGQPAGRADERDAPLRLARIEDDHPVMAPFRGLPGAALDAVQVYRHIPLEVPHGTGARPLAWLDNDRPFLVHRRVGRGHAFLFATTANAAWTNFPTRVLYLPMIHQIVYHAVGQRDEAASLLAGAPMLFPPRPGGERPELEVVDPLGRRTRMVNPAGEVSRGPARFDDTARPGIYRWRMLDGNGEGAFVVNPNPAQSDLKALDEEAVRTLFGGHPVYFVRTPEEGWRIAERLRTGVQLWNLVLLLVIAIAIAECFLANRRTAAAPVGGRKRAA